MEQSLLVNETLWGLVNTFIRIRAALFIMKLFGSFTKVIFIARLIIILSILYGLVVVLEIFICRPLAMTWNSARIIHFSGGNWTPFRLFYLNNINITYLETEFEVSSQNRDNYSLFSWSFVGVLSADRRYIVNN